MALYNISLGQGICQGVLKVIGKNHGALRNSAKKAKVTIENNLKKSFKTIKEKKKKVDSIEEKALCKKKLERINCDLKILNMLAEDDIITFALNTEKNLMAVAANQRLPMEMRMKARVASHKPLSTQLARIKKKRKTSKQSECSNVEDGDNVEENSEEGGGENCKLDKIPLNNQIVKMRSNVKRSKVHIIHKLTRNLQKIRKKNGSEELDVKYENRAQRLIKKIKYIKEAEVDDISKFALSTTLNLNKACSDVKLPLKTQAMATVALHKFVNGSVEEFKRKYPDWKKTVPPLLRKKKKRKLKIESESEVLKKDCQLSESDEKSDESSADQEGGTSDREIQSEESDSFEENKMDEGNSENLDCTESDSENVKMEMEIISENEEGDSETLLEEVPTIQHPKKELIDLSRQDCTKIKTHDALISSVNFPEQKVREDFKPPKIKSQKIAPQVEKEPEVQDKPKIVDPFFITKNDEEYITSQVPVFSDGKTTTWRSKDEDFSYKKSDSFMKVGRQDNKWGGRQDSWKKNNFSSHRVYPHKPFSNPFEKIPDKPTQPLGHLGNRKERRKVLQVSKPEKDERLHPSWEAKKKLSSGIMKSFEGKKIIFD